ncbi:hypothetical protein [Halioxenophilus sp. WMMB6]|uniref:hypothetical protein n=1 Tax=Halioxenophilus sp. WMMB6 TaxID=3073815 RepID=UPI00295E91FB|nr:hypothetical protein [Halioxenophilus sp. WMMB6]
MLPATTQPLALDADLKAALQRLASLGQTTLSELDTLKNAFNPLQSLVAVGLQMNQFLYNSQWLNILFDKNRQEDVQDSLSELRDIQQAGTTRWSQAQQQLLKDSLSDLQQAFTSLQPQQSLQQNLARIINQKIDSYTQLQQDLSQQAATLNAIGSAYSAWWQSTVEKFSTRTPAL